MRVKYEYYQLDMNAQHHEKIIDVLNQHGQDGWQLCHVADMVREFTDDKIPAQTFQRLFFIRPLEASVPDGEL